MLRDDGGKALPFVALNTNGPFAKGKNCGRWIKINLKENCVGGGNSKFSVCIGNGSARPLPRVRRPCRAQTNLGCIPARGHRARGSVERAVPRGGGACCVRAASCAAGRCQSSHTPRSAEYKNDQHSGKTIYGYVQDSCADNNYWCQKDTNHLDISKPYLDSKGMTGGWNGRKVEWQFLKGTPPGCATIPPLLLAVAFARKEWL